MEIRILDHGYVRHIEHMGNDLTPLEAARMSTGNPTGEDETKDDRLRDYLWRNHHATPFEMNVLHLELQVPIFIARQIMRHRTFSYNEFSGRYAEMPDLYYIPDVDRIQEQAETNKQASGKGLSTLAQEEARDWMIQATREARRTYNDLIAIGVARETARMVLPLNQYTRFRMCGNLRNWEHFATLRDDGHAQYEVQVVGKAVRQVVAHLWPKTAEVFAKHAKKEITV